MNVRELKKTNEREEKRRYGFVVHIYFCRHLPAATRPERSSVLASAEHERNTAFGKGAYYVVILALIDAEQLRE